MGSRPCCTWLHALPCPASLPGWSGSALLLLELWLLRDVSHCQHGLEFNTYLYLQSMAVAQQPVQMFWVGVWLWGGSLQPVCGRLCVAQAQEHSQLRAPHTLSSSAPSLPSLPAGHTPELMFLAQKVTLSLHACCVFMSHLRRDRVRNLEQFLNRLCPFVVAAPVDSCCPGVRASPGVGKCPVTWLSWAWQALSSSQDVLENLQRKFWFGKLSLGTACCPFPAASHWL